MGRDFISDLLTEWQGRCALREEERLVSVSDPS
jgi:hypothetical protein